MSAVGARTTKTAAMQLAEIRWRKPAEQAIVEALNGRNPDGTRRTMDQAAAVLGIPRSTMALWIDQLGVDYPVARLAG
jgi:hypothetical protein